TSITGSVGVNIYNDTSKAVIQSGARINQLSPTTPGWHPSTAQSVSVTAETMMQFAEMAGIGKWSLNDSPFAKGYAEGKTAAQLKSGGDIVDIYGRSGYKSLGGSVLYDEINNTVYARIEGDARVGTGTAGSLTIKANEDILRVAIAQAGGKTDDEGSFA